MAQFLYICETGFSFDFLEQNRTENRTQPELKPELEQCMKRKRGREAAQRRQAVKRIEISAPSKSSSKEFSLIRLVWGLALLDPSGCLSICLSLSLSLSPATALSRELPVEKGNTRRQLFARWSPRLNVATEGGGITFLGVVAASVAVAAAAATPNDKVYPLSPCGPFSLWCALLLLAPSLVFLYTTGLTSFRGCSVGSCGTVWRVLRTTLPFFLFLFSSIYVP